ncbi:MAG TPA: hypothetical protein VGX94_18965 [Terriglobia bacterium]|nr:hypothetical protein [Terriglobia bacterium]
MKAPVFSTTGQNLSGTTWINSTPLNQLRGEVMTIFWAKYPLSS